MWLVDFLLEIVFLNEVLQLGNAGILPAPIHTDDCLCFRALIQKQSNRRAKAALDTLRPGNINNSNSVSCFIKQFMICCTFIESIAPSAAIRASRHASNRIKY